MTNKNKKINLFIFLMIFLLGAIFYLPKIKALAAQGGATEINELSKKIKAKQANIETLRKKLKIYQKNLDTERAKTRSLKNQLVLLDTQIKQKETEIKLNAEEINKVNLEIEKTEEKIKTSQNSIESKKDEISKLIREIYREDQKNNLEIILMHDSISSYFNQLKTDETIRDELNDKLIDLKKMNKELTENKKNLSLQKDSLEKMQLDLTAKKDALTGQKASKKYILSQTRYSESRYRRLVRELEAEQNKANAEIMALEKAMRAKLSGANKSKLSQLGDVFFSWPVPSRTITTYFHDPDYPFRYLFEHPGIDIRAAQGTPLKAAASGYVARARDNGYGYSYIMIVHNDGFSTVYGHVSAIYVKPDQFVTQGEIIGATGGMPGTRGAGRLTTGPHLHFEIRKNGIPVNPLDYLP